MPPMRITLTMLLHVQPTNLQRLGRALGVRLPACASDLVRHRLLAIEISKITDHAIGALALVVVALALGVV